MKNNKSVKFFILFFITFGATLYPQALYSQLPQKKSANSSVLSLVDNYVAPPYPKDATFTKETYDYRINNGLYVPPTFSATLVCDVWQMRNADVTRMTPSQALPIFVKSGIDVYTAFPWTQISGYRPWTNWNFINSLNPRQRAILANEITNYIIKHSKSLRC